MSDDDDLEDPALKGFNEGVYKTQHVVGKTLKGALLGAVIGAVALTAMAAAVAIFSVPFGGLLALVGISTPMGAGLAAGAAIKTLTAGAIIGSGLGGTWGLVSGVTGADEAADQRKEDLYAQKNRSEVRRERAHAMEISKQQQAMAMMAQGQQMGLMPPTTPPGMQTGKNEPQIGG